MKLKQLLKVMKQQRDGDPDFTNYVPKKGALIGMFYEEDLGDRPSGELRLAMLTKVSLPKPGSDEQFDGMEVQYELDGEVAQGMDDYTIASLEKVKFVFFRKTTIKELQEMK